MNPIPELTPQLKKLRLSGILTTLEQRNREAVERIRRVFAGSPVKRLGRDRFVRNVLIALGNSGGVEAAPVAEGRLDDASPLVRAMAVWALARLLPGPDYAALRDRHLPGEIDPAVQAEWGSS